MQTASQLEMLTERVRAAELEKNLKLIDNVLNVLFHCLLNVAQA